MVYWHDDIICQSHVMYRQKQRGGFNDYSGSTHNNVPADRNDRAHKPRLGVPQRETMRFSGLLDGDFIGYDESKLSTAALD